MELIPENKKSSESVDIFKSKIKKWVPEICPCRLCKTYANQVGFVNNVLLGSTVALLFLVFSVNRQKKFFIRILYIFVKKILIFIVLLLVH